MIMNPISMLQQFMKSGGNPRNLVMKTMEMNKSNMMMNNLVSMAKEGNVQNIEQFARNYFNEKGMDFDKEFAEFMKNFNN